ncbi:hypothetical protein NDU88_001749 [Pleurodeles waltl]|uniref:Uncharacterized protein n=1 Tax=Pleurodeles waltl TaxID=8319 RepID=A0AAV7TKK0_PLEWA|nr:hypothetical protein NDU88_001749 [Pleurodeles waltl]
MTTADASSLSKPLPIVSGDKEGEYVGKKKLLPLTKSRQADAPFLCSEHGCFLEAGPRFFSARETFPRMVRRKVVLFF